MISNRFYVRISTIMDIVRSPTINYKSMNLRGQDAWRRHPLFLNLWKNPFPGLKPAIIVFSAMVGAEYAFKYITLGPPPKKATH
mmetsp:Transcript_7774/g.14658  ORF Transcript_7774/g.14658 Transcript_7774/m.14658 type:complete len:84 (+) Transcript_7774:488-739(+)